MRRPLLIGNWKMNHGLAQTSKWFVDAADCAWPASVELAVAPVFTSLGAAAAARTAGGGAIALAAQTCHHATDGAFTGEIAPPMLAEIGVRYVLVGHSERRQLFGETDAVVQQKVSAVLAAGLSAVLCVGETLAERDGDQTFDVVASQLGAALQDVKGASVASVVVAYEPVWAIGTGRTATPAQAQEVHAHIRRLLSQQWGQAASLQTRILYGGSVKPGNTAALMAGPDIDGALVGGASLVAADFAAIAAAMA